MGRNACLYLVDVTYYFPGNQNSPDSHGKIKLILDAYHKLECNILLKIHFLHSYLNFLPENIGSLCQEHGERFHQVIAKLEKRHQGKWKPVMLADY